MSDQNQMHAELTICGGARSRVSDPRPRFSWIVDQKLTRK